MELDLAQYLIPYRGATNCKRQVGAIALQDFHRVVDFARNYLAIYQACPQLHVKCFFADRGDVFVRVGLRREVAVYLAPVIRRVRYRRTHPVGGYLDLRLSRNHVANDHGSDMACGINRGERDIKIDGIFTG